MLALDWNSRELRIVVGKVQRGRTVFVSAMQREWPTDLNKADPISLGNEIRKVLDAKGERDRDAVACVDRRNLVLKRIALPNVEKSETHELLRLQALRDLTIPVEQAVIDHMLIPPSESAPHGQAILAVLRRDALATIQSTFLAAGLQLKSLWPGSLARAESARYAFMKSTAVAGEGNLCQALVVVDDRDLELVLLQDGRFLASVARPIAGEGETADLTAALRRAVMTLSTQLPQQRIVHLLFAGTAPNLGNLSQEFQQLADSDLSTFDPLEEIPAAGIDRVSADQRGGFAGSVGALLLASRNAVDSIDFLHPKQPTIKADLRRPLGLVAAGVVLACGMQTHRHYAAQRDRSTEATKKYKAEEANLAKQLKGLSPRKEKAELIASWRAGDMKEMDVLDRLFRAVAAAEHVSLVSIGVSPSPRREEYTAAISIEGLADSQTTVTELHRRLSRDAGFEVRPGPVQPAGRTGAETLWRFSAELLAK